MGSTGSGAVGTSHTKTVGCVDSRDVVDGDHSWDGPFARLAPSLRAKEPFWEQLGLNFVVSDPVAEKHTGESLDWMHVLLFWQMLKT